MKHSFMSVLVVGLLMMGCDAPAPPTPMPIRDVRQINSAQEFIDALGPRRTLILQGNVLYRLDDLPRGVSDFYRWEEAIPGQAALIVRNCDSLTIMAATDDDPAHIVTAHPYANVLGFENCRSLRLGNLKLGHNPDPGYCTGGVLGLEGCDDAAVSKTTLYGCGTEGLTLTGVDNLRIVDSVIEQCSYGLLTAYDCDGLTFVRSVFRDTEEFYGFALQDTVNVLLEDCRIEDNIVGGHGGALFTTNLTVAAGRIRMTGGSIVGNKVTKLVRPEGMLLQNGVDVRDNLHQQPENFPSAD